MGAVLSNCIDCKRVTSSEVLLLKLCFRDCKITAFLHTLNCQDQHVTIPYMLIHQKRPVQFYIKDPQCLSNAFQRSGEGEAQLS